MKKYSSLTILTTLMCAMIITIGSFVTSPARAQSVSELLAGSVITNVTSQNALSIKQNGTVGKGRSDSGALLVNNTGNQHTGLTVYSNLGSLVAQPLVRLEVDNEDWDEEVLYIRSDSPTSRGLIRLDSPAPEIEFVETDQTGAAGKFEVRVQHDTFQVNSRRSDDTTFENKLNVTHSGDLELVTGALKVLSSRPSEFKGGINITGGCLAINGTCVSEASLQSASVTSGSEASDPAVDNKATIVNGVPKNTACNSYQEQGLFVLDTKNNRLYVCNGPERGWDYTTLSN